MASDKKVTLIMKRADGNETKVQLKASGKAEAKAILLARWESRFVADDGDTPGSDKFRAKRDAWVKAEYGEFV